MFSRFTRCFSTNYDTSNKVDFTVDISATDAETGDAIDFTGAEVAIAVSDEGADGCTRFSAKNDCGVVSCIDVANGTDYYEVFV